VVSFKTAAGAITSIQSQTLRFVCYSDTNSGRLKIDMATTTGGKHNPSLLGRRVMLISKTHMHPESSLDPEHCTPKSDAKAKSRWLHSHINIVDQYEDVYSPETNEGDTYMEEDPIPTDAMHMATTMFPLKAATLGKGHTLPHHLWPKSVLHDVYALRARTKALRRLAAAAAATPLLTMEAISTA
jgi:hypothetical protein